MTILARLLAALSAASMTLLMAGAVSAHPAEGDWLGTIAATPTAALRLALHLHEDPKGAWNGTIDSLDQAAYDMPLADIVAGADTLAFTFPRVSAHYEGRWDPAAHKWAGQWTQGARTIPLELSLGMVPPSPVVAGLDGDWDGALSTGMGVQLRLALHVTTGPRGTAAVLESIDQGTKVAASAITRDGQRTRLEVKTLPASFQGVLDAQGKILTGAWTQGGRDLPLVLTRRAPGQAGAALVRPQTPVKPYPYREEEVVFDNPAGGARLAGTLTLPQGAGPFPVAVLVAGSGPNTRNEPIMGHQIFLVLADHLTRQGVAVLRYDKRGTGGSTGDYAKATTRDFAADVEAGMAYLKTRKDIAPGRIGLIGHSEGGLIVPMVAAHDRSTAFIVIMAGPAVNGLDILREQARLISKAGGLSEARIARGQALRDQMFATVMAEKDPAVAAVKLRAALAGAAKADGLPDSAVEAQIAQINSDWFRFFFDYDPAPALREVTCPVLALNGSLDLQVPAAQNLPPMRAALAGNPKAEVMELPRLNHLFQTATTGGLAEYGQIEETIAPVALDTITRWILAHDAATK